jgi:hypothetical protein
MKRGPSVPSWQQGNRVAKNRKAAEGSQRIPDEALMRLGKLFWQIASEKAEREVRRAA